jgi:hypothetical protein
MTDITATDTTAPAPACPFYGMSGVLPGQLIPTHGNQCALIKTSHAPCAMEIGASTPEETNCPLIARLIMDRAQEDPTP